MKSLKIVDKLLEKINQYDDWFLTEMEAEQIKQDLEVLEIIRKKRVNVAELVGELIYFDNDEDVLEDYNSILCKGRQLTLTELLKLKQWLEENDE